MKYTRTIKKNIGNLLFRLIKYHNVLRLEKGSYIDPSAKLREVSGKGKIIIESKAKVIGGAYLSGEIRIGKYSSLNGPNLSIYSKVNHVQIGNFCSIARNVSIQEYNHKSNATSTYLMSKNVFGQSDKEDFASKGSILIGHDVWIGASSMILSGVNISDGAIIASNSVVTKNVPPYAIVGGNPAVVLKYRFPANVINKLLELEWWNWDQSKIKANYSFLTKGNLQLEDFNGIL